VPNSGGMRGIEAAAVLGAAGGKADRILEVLEDIREEDITKTRELLASHFVDCKLQEGVENLYVKVCVYGKGHSAEVTVSNHHTEITEIVKDGAVIEKADGTQHLDKSEFTDWSILSILQFAKTVDVDKVRSILDRQIKYNSAISSEGLSNAYGAQVGRTLLETYGNDIRVRARASAAAGSDARMGGCSLPVVINSGSGNQGLALSLPVIEYAKELHVPKEKLYRALLISNLLSIYIKHYIGSLSAFCGAVTAGCGCGAAVTYLHGGDDQAIARTMINMLANVEGIICDGAKPSCAAKIAASVDAAILAHEMSMKGLVFHPGEGIVQDNVEDTVRSIGYIGRVGMKQTDIEVLHLMLGAVTL